MGMTEYEVRNLLKSIKYLAEKHDKKVEQCLELRAVAESCTVRTDKECIQTSGSGDKMANIVPKIVELDLEIRELEERIDSLRNVITDLSGKLSNDRHSQYIITRYVDCHGFYDTVMILELTDSTARRIEKKAISELTKLINNNI